MLHQRRLTVALALGVAGLGAAADLGRAQEQKPRPGEIQQLSLEDLLDLTVVSGSRKPEKLSRAPATVYVVTEDDIRRNGYLELKDVLETVPGVTAIDLGYFLVGGQRGFLGNFSQTLLLVNGREMANLVAGETFVSHQFATHNVERVEVLQGPGSALYGANALVGVVNVITKHDSPDFEGTEVHLDLGTHDSQAYGVVFGRTFRGLRIGGSLRYSSSDGFDFGPFINDPAYHEGTPSVGVARIDGRHRYTNHSAATPVSLHLGYKGFHAGRESFVLDTQDGLENVSLDYENLRDHRQFALTYAGWRHGWGRGIETSLEYQHSREKFWGVLYPFDEDVYAARYPQGGRIPEDDVFRHFAVYYSQENSRGSRRDRAALQVSLDELTPSSSLIAGLVYDRSDVMGIATSTADPAPFFDETRRQGNPHRPPVLLTDKTSAYLQYQRSLAGDRLALTLGGRLDRLSLYGTVATVRSGLVYRAFGKANVKLLFGQAFREPAPFERGTSVNFLPNPSIRPSKLDAFELSLGGPFRKDAFGSVTFYTNLARDVIVPLDTYTFTNRDASRRVSGAEAQASVRFARRLTLDLSHAVADSGAEVFAGRRVDSLGIYRNRGNLGLRYQASTRLDLNARASYYGLVSAAHGNPSVDEVVRIPSAVRLDLTALLRDVAIEGTRADLFVTVRNVFDRDIDEPNVRRGGPRQFRLPGREVLARLTWRF